MRGVPVRFGWLGLLCCAVAQAQPTTPVAPRDERNELKLFPIVVQGRPWDLKVTLSTAEGRKPFLYCEGTCDAWVYPGEYWVDVRSTPHTVAGRRRIELTEPSKVEVRARRRDETSATGVVGLVLVPSGLGLIAMSFGVAHLEQQRADHDPAMSGAASLFMFGALVTVSGLLCMVIGGSQTVTVPKVSVVPTQ
jgi:hypothetical protein